MDQIFLRKMMRSALEAMLRESPDPASILERAEMELLALLSGSHGNADEASRIEILNIVHEVVQDARSSLRPFPID
jgi:hypothetical protein